MLYRHLTVSPVEGQAATFWTDDRMEMEQEPVTAHGQTVTSCCAVLSKLLNAKGGSIVGSSGPDDLLFPLRSWILSVS
jgi:hypothetical protein